MGAPKKPVNERFQPVYQSREVDTLEREVDRLVNTIQNMGMLRQY